MILGRVEHLQLFEELMTKKKAKSSVPLYHPTQVELANIVAKAREEAEGGHFAALMLLEENGLRQSSANHRFCKQHCSGYLPEPVSLLLRQYTEAYEYSI